MTLTGGEVVFAREKDGRLASLTLSRPGTKNAITWEMRERISDCFEEIDKDPEIRIVVIRGADECFSSGGDIPGFLEMEPVEFTDLGSRLTAPARTMKLVIAAIDGYCLGAGLELAMSCDLRIATRRSTFGQPEMRLGMIPGSGGTQRLARLIGLTRAKYVIMTGEQFGAEDAFAWGLLSNVVDDPEELEAKVDQIVDIMLSYSPLALRTAKEVLDRGVDGPLATGIELERKAYSMLRASQDFQEGVNAYLEKRPPKFGGT